MESPLLIAFVSLSLASLCFGTGTLLLFYGANRFQEWMTPRQYNPQPDFSNYYKRADEIVPPHTVPTKKEPLIVTEHLGPVE